MMCCRHLVIISKLLKVLWMRGLLSVLASIPTALSRRVHMALMILLTGAT